MLCHTYCAGILTGHVNKMPTHNAAALLSRLHSRFVYRTPIMISRYFSTCPQKGQSDCPFQTSPCAHCPAGYMPHALSYTSLEGAFCQPASAPAHVSCVALRALSCRLHATCALLHLPGRSVLPACISISTCVMCRPARTMLDHSKQSAAAGQNCCFWSTVCTAAAALKVMAWSTWLMHSLW
jgi:hypothetical protein